jgi:plasmid rolling circle replication initiator protein Rep
VQEFVSIYCTNPNFKFKTDPKIMADIMQAFKEEKTTEDRAKQKAVAAAARKKVNKNGTLNRDGEPE